MALYRNSRISRRNGGKSGAINEPPIFSYTMYFKPIANRAKPPASFIHGLQGSHQIRLATIYKKSARVGSASRIDVQTICVKSRSCLRSRISFAFVMVETCFSNLRSLRSEFTIPVGSRDSAVHQEIAAGDEPAIGPH